MEKLATNDMAVPNFRFNARAVFRELMELDDQFLRNTLLSFLGTPINNPDLRTCLKNSKVRDKFIYPDWFSEIVIENDVEFIDGQLIDGEPPCYNKVRRRDVIEPDAGVSFYRVNSLQAYHLIFCLAEPEFKDQHFTEKWRQVLNGFAEGHEVTGIDGIHDCMDFCIHTIVPVAIGGMPENQSVYLRGLNLSLDDILSDGIEAVFLSVDNWVKYDVLPITGCSWSHLKSQVTQLRLGSKEKQHSLATRIEQLLAS